MSTRPKTDHQPGQYFFDFQQLPAHTFTKHTTSNGTVVKGDKIYVGLVNKPRASGSQPHRHPFEQFNYVLKGKLKAWVGGQEQVIGAGGLIHIPANTLHTIVATPEEDVVFLMVKEVTPMGTAGIPEDPTVTGPRYEPGSDPKNGWAIARQSAAKPWMAPTAVRTTSRAWSRSNGMKTDEKHGRVTQVQSRTPAEEAMAREPEPGNELLLRMMEQLVLIREFESKCEAMWKTGEHLVGEYHLSLGQEAIAVGTCAAIEPSDLICPSIRGMGVSVCRGTPLSDLMKTFFDREEAICGGRWAHWHSPVAEAGLLAQTGMLGSGLVTSAGAALTQQYLRTGKVVVAMLGGGATNTGYFHEGMNFAAFRQLPIVIIIENNGYAVSTPLASVVNVKHLSSRAAGYGMPGVTIDGNDVLLVYNTVRGAVKRARCGHGPTLIECMTYRFGGSTVKVPDQLRPLVEKEEEVPAGEYVVPIGKSAVKAAGKDVTVACVGRCVHDALQAHGRWADQGVSIEVLDLRTLRPLDVEAIRRSVAKTGRLITVHEGWASYGIGAEVVACVSDGPELLLRAPARRVGTIETHIPASPRLAAAVLPNAKRIDDAIASVMG